MSASNLGRIVFLVLLAFAAIHFFSIYNRLPDMVASHFNSRGVPNGWQQKQVFFGTFVFVTLACIFLLVGPPRFIAAAPPERINLPNKAYWLAPEHRATAFEMIGSFFSWFGCGVFFVLATAFDYAAQYNLDPAHPPAMTRLWYTLAIFIAFVLFLVVRLITRFSRIPAEPGKLS